jgi:hypothetical protein
MKENMTYHRIEFKAVYKILNPNGRVHIKVRRSMYLLFIVLDYLKIKALIKGQWVAIKIVLVLDFIR